ncbi:MAG: ArsA-related P-loop ATPase [Ilumatobacter fluminis]|uniref:Anion-transporting ArsA/GET3 family ATPase n=1 Tax=Ilumatobacter fluminis TaxID=467091 RepID=A0A4R7I3C6_9ACTN|nr:ArsA-related P-loop ATPase [Ilumatobacter fluminis]TDT17744.1 anion-transporting ArsA/GET3 family ATPase [Ilumatobacter fluminis]
MAADLVALLAAKEMVLVCGSGGVGKTTTAAAMGVAAAINTKGRVLVLTIDPARRLADALGIGALGNEATRVPDDAFADAGVEPRGELWAAMLDTKAGWDELIRRHAPDAKVRDSVLANPLYQNITSRFVHSHDYLAMERLHELHTSGEYDLIIVDTPPSRNAIAFLDAPGRMKEFFGSTLLKWLTVPYRSRLFTMASKPFYQVADRVLGSRFLQDIAEFFILFQAMERGFVRHATEVEKILSDPRTTFVVVSTLEAAPTHEATYLARALRRRDLHLGAIIANRVLPKSFTTKSAKQAARKLVKRSDEWAEALDIDADADEVSRVLAEMGRRFDDVAVVAKRETERSSELSSMSSLVVSVPVLDRDVDDLTDLVELTGSFGA